MRISQARRTDEQSTAPHRQVMPRGLETWVRQHSRLQVWVMSGRYLFGQACASTISQQLEQSERCPSRQPFLTGMAASRGVPGPGCHIGLYWPCRAGREIDVHMGENCPHTQFLGHSDQFVGRDQAGGTAGFNSIRRGFPIICAAWASRRLDMAHPRAANENPRCLSLRRRDIELLTVGRCQCRVLPVARPCSPHLRYSCL